MITQAEQTNPTEHAAPRIWGLDPVQLHDRFWAARGVQVVRQGERSQIVKHAELFLLTDRRTLTIFKIGHLVEQLSWMHPDVLFVRLHEAREHGYKEQVVTDSTGRFQRIRRIYGASDSRMTRLAITHDRRIAEAWQNTQDARSEWRNLRRRIPRSRRIAVSIDGNVYDRQMPAEIMQCLRDLVQVWQSPDATIYRARRIAPGVWADVDSQLPPAVKFVGPAWIGVGRTDISQRNIIGPAVLWDDSANKLKADDLEWQEIEPRPVFERPVRVRNASSFYRLTKRAFDIVFSAAVLLAILPIFPIIMFAIWIENGRPFFFAHRRETIGGKEFPCIKFRSMRNDAESIKHQLSTKNQADGPQFFIDPDNDPRLTRVGAILRKLNLDELPQFINVLVGHMSVVGPRPSPRAENQCCPPWREARLSVRPGITGLWQVMRTRQQGLDFQEWIKYDIEYVEHASWRFDIWIIWRTALLLLRLSD